LNCLLPLYVQGDQDCRLLHCPTAQRLVNGQCTHIVNNWNKFRLLLNIEIAFPDFDDKPGQLEKTIALATWLSRQPTSVTPWRGWTIIHLHACHTEHIARTFVTVTVERKAQKVEPKTLLKSIKHLLNKDVHVNISDTTVRYLAQKFHHSLYDDNLEDVSVSLCDNPYDNRFTWVAPFLPKDSAEKVDTSECSYCHRVPVNLQTSSFFITNLFYCDQVVFNESEFENIGSAVHVHAINKTFLDLEYELVQRDSRAFVHVCADMASYFPPSPGARVEIAVRHYIWIVFTVLVKLSLPDG